jgi:hypothetical protein
MDINEVGSSASTQLVGFCQDKKTKQVAFSKEEKDAVLLYYLLSKHTQQEEPLQKHYCTDSGFSTFAEALLYRFGYSTFAEALLHRLGYSTFAEALLHRLRFLTDKQLVTKPIVC